jgi:hypothetical protein
MEVPGFLGEQKVGAKNIGSRLAVAGAHWASGAREVHNQQEFLASLLISVHNIDRVANRSPDF